MKWMVILLLICSLKNPGLDVETGAKKEIFIGGAPIEYAELFKSVKNFEEDLGI